MDNRIQESADSFAIILREKIKNHTSASAKITFHQSILVKFGYSILYDGINRPYSGNETWLNKFIDVDFVLNVPPRSKKKLDLLEYKKQIGNNKEVKKILLIHENICVKSYENSYNLIAKFDDGTEDLIRYNSRNVKQVKVSHIVSRGKDDSWTFSYTNEQKLENSAKYYYQKGLKYITKKQYIDAIYDFKYARSDAQSDSLMLKINIQDAKAHLQYGQDLYLVAWKLEEDGNFQKANKTFAEALDYFQRSIEFAYRDDTERSLEECKLKIDGNTLANEGLELENKFASLHKKAKKSKDPDMYIDARRTLEKAIENYEKAIRTFEKGFKFNKKFEDCISLIQAGLPKLRDIKGPIEQAGFKAISDHLKLDIGEIRNLKYV